MVHLYKTTRGLFLIITSSSGHPGTKIPAGPSQAREIPLGPRWQIVLVAAWESGDCSNCIFPLIAFVTCGVCWSEALVSDVLHHTAELSPTPGERMCRKRQWIMQRHKTWAEQQSSWAPRPDVLQDSWCWGPYRTCNVTQPHRRLPCDKYKAFIMWCAKI